MPRVTIVTAAKNAAAFLPATIASVRHQTFTDWTHVIVDDASTDATASVVETAASADARVRLVRLEESVGAYAAANIAVLAADSDYIARLDADDLAERSRLEKQVAALAASTRAVANVTGWHQINADGTRRPETFALPTHSNAVVKWMLWLRGGPLHSSLLVDTAWLQERGGYGPERIGEDNRLWCALTREGRMSMLDEPLVSYRLHGDQITANKKTYEDPNRLGIRLEHFQLCGAGPEWTLDDARDLMRIGRWGTAPFGVAHAYELLDRWSAEWHKDSALTADERSELAARSARMRLVHTLRSTRARQPGVVRGLTRNAVSLATAAARFAAKRPSSWLSD